jgi:hypothetical protein
MIGKATGEIRRPLGTKTLSSKLPRTVYAIDFNVGEALQYEVDHASTQRFECSDKTRHGEDRHSHVSLDATL